MKEFSFLCSQVYLLCFLAGKPLLIHRLLQIQPFCWLCLVFTDSISVIPGVSHFKLWNCNELRVAGAQWVGIVCLPHIKMCRKCRRRVKTSGRQQWALIRKGCMITCFFSLLGTKLDYTSQPPLQLGVAVWLRSSYWIVGGRDAGPIGPPIPPSPLFRLLSEGLADIIGAGRAKGRRSLCPWKATWAVLYLYFLYQVLVLELF